MRSVVAWGAIVIGVIAVASALLGVFDGRSDIALPPPEGIITQLDEEQKAEAVELVETDSRLKTLVGNRPYTHDEVAAWATVDGKMLLGAILKLKLSKAVTTGTSNWPLMIAAAAGSSVRAKKPYITRTARLSVENASEILAAVDLRKSKVVGLMPGGPDLKVRVIRYYGAPPGPGFREREGY